MHRPPHSTLLSLESSWELAKAQAFCYMTLSVASGFRIRQQRRSPQIGRPLGVVAVSSKLVRKEGVQTN